MYKYRVQVDLYMFAFHAHLYPLCAHV